MKLSRPLPFQYVTISKAFINTFTVLDMVQHHNLTYTEKSGWTGKKIQHHYVTDYDLTNTTKSGYTEIKIRNSSTNVSHNVSTVFVRLRYEFIPG